VVMGRGFILIVLPVLSLPPLRRGFSFRQRTSVVLRQHSGGNRSLPEEPPPAAGNWPSAEDQDPSFRNTLGPASAGSFFLEPILAPGIALRERNVRTQGSVWPRSPEGGAFLDWGGANSALYS